MTMLTMIPSLMSHSELCSAIGAQVRARRQRAKLSRAELAKKSGVSVPTIGRLETKGVATISVLVKLAQALDATDTLGGLFAIPKHKTMKEFLEAEGE